MAEAIIVSNPEIMMGKPTVAGTRITVELILEKLAAGHSHEDILEGYPRLTRESISAALIFAASALNIDWADNIAEQYSGIPIQVWAEL